MHASAQSRPGDGCQPGAGKQGGLLALALLSLTTMGAACGLGHSVRPSELFVHISRPPHLDVECGLIMTNVHLEDADIRAPTLSFIAERQPEPQKYTMSGIQYVDARMPKQ